jgi:hypothetical protein
VHGRDGLRTGHASSFVRGSVLMLAHGASPRWVERRQTSGDDLLVERPEHLVALTGGRLQAAPVDDSDPAPAVGDKPGPLECPRSETDRLATDAEHLGQELVGEREVVPPDSIVRHQQPAAGSLLERVQRIAGDRLAGVSQRIGRVPLHQTVELGVSLDRRQECIRLHADRLSGHLQDGGLARGFEAQMERQADHALVSDRRRLDPLATLPVDHDRVQTRRGEANVEDRASLPANFMPLRVGDAPR